MTNTSLKLFLLAITIFCFSSSSSSQTQEKIVAEIGNIKINTKEFRYRFELSPFVSHRSGRNQDSLKADFLYSLIAEKLWYLDALEKGLANSEEFRFYFKPIEDIFLRDALFKKEVEEKVKLSADDVSNAIHNAQYKLIAKILTSTDSTFIFDLYSKLQANKNHDSLLSTIPSNSLSAKQFEITLGSLKDEEVENYIFSLSPNEFTKPIKSEVGWVIFLIKDKLFSPVDLSNEASINRIKSIIRNRKIMIRTDEYLKSLLGNMTIDIDDNSFRLIADKIYERLISSPQSKKDTAGIVLNDNDYRIIKSQLGEENLNKEIFRIFDKKVTIWDFLANLAFEEHRFQFIVRNQIYSKLTKIVKDFVVKQYLTYEARRKGLDKDLNLIEDLKNWEVHYLAQMLRFTYLDSARVTEEEVIEYFNNEFRKDKSNFLIKLKILNVKELEEVENILNQISTGKSFDEILKQYGKTDTLVNESGETELLPHLYFGDLGTIASKLNIGEVYGPIRRNDNYTLFMLTDRKEISDTTQIDFASSKDYIKNYLFMKKFNSIIAKQTIQLSKKYGVKIYDDVLAEIKTTQIPMFVHRLMGFGGRIAGVPLLDNWFNLIDIEAFKSQLLP